MTTFLVVGPLTITVAESAMVSRKQPVMGGTKSRAYFGNMHVTFRWQARAWATVTAPLSDTDATALETLIALGAAQVCSGSALVGSGGTSLVCIVSAPDAPAYTPTDGGTGLGFMRQVALLIEEASP